MNYDIIKELTDLRKEVANLRKPQFFETEDSSLINLNQIDSMTFVNDLRYYVKTTGGNTIVISIKDMELLAKKLLGGNKDV